MNDHSRRSSRSSLRALDLALQFNSLGRHPALGPASLCLRLRLLQPPHIWNLQFKKKNHIGRKLQYSPSYEVTTKKKEKKKPRARFWTTSPLSSLPPAIEPSLTLIKTINHQHRPTRERRSRREKKKKLLRFGARTRTSSDPDTQTDGERADRCGSDGSRAQNVHSKTQIFVCACACGLFPTFFKCRSSSAAQRSQQLTHTRKLL